MKSKVYFIRSSDSDGIELVRGKLSRLLEESRLFDFIRKGDKVAVKMHFGEEGNTGFVKPEYLRVVCDDISKKQATPLLADTNTLYRGKRMNSKDHLSLAYEHGFTKDRAGAEVIIPDDTKKEDSASVMINEKFVETAKVAAFFLQADAIVAVSHFKGHLMAGFGGAMKNLGMGCATIEGKLSQHSDVSPLTNRKICLACEKCIEICPAGAISIRNKKSVIDGTKCIGCASCIAICAQGAIDVDWEAGGSRLQEKMIEYAKAVLKNKQNKCAFINFAVKITKECDCLAKDDPRIAPDIGLLASTDPLAIDKASLDLVNNACGKDIFKEAHPNRNGIKQLEHAALLGLGNLNYDLFELT